MILFGYGNFGLGYGYGYDATFVLVIIALAITSYASLRVKTAFSKYSKIVNHSGYTGADAASIFLNNHAMKHVKLVSTQGNLTDHFDPGKETVRLSESNYYGGTIAAVAVAAHECGHVLQHKDQYLPLKIRAGLVPIVNFSSKLAWPIFFIGLIISSFDVLVPLGIALFGAAVVFHLVTLPVELDASRRAMVLLRENNILQTDELKGAKSVLNAAALTYIAAAMGSLLQLIRLVLIAGRYRRRD